MQTIKNHLEISVRQNAFGLSRRLLTIAVSSGKGGTGKTNVVANLGFAFTQLQKKVLILDGNLGLSNIGGLLGLTSSYNVEQLLNNQKSIGQVLLQGPGGMLILPASCGNEKLVNPSTGEKIYLLEELEQLADIIDVLLIDTPAGISPNVMFFNSIAAESIVVTTNEITSLSAAYILIKIMATKYKKTRFKILVNFAKTAKEGKEVFKNIITLADAYLFSISLDYLGFIPLDEKLKHAVKRQRLVAEIYPQSPSSQRFKEIANYFIDSQLKMILQTPVPRSPTYPKIRKEEENEITGGKI